MTKNILLSPIAQKQFESLDRTLKDRFRKALKDLGARSHDKRSVMDIKKLHGVKDREDLYRLRVGDYRIIFFEEKADIMVIQILHRSRAYDWL